MPTCAYCRGPVTSSGQAGRPWPDGPPATYCCYGCLSLGEQRRQEDAVPGAPGPSWRLDGLGIRLGISLLVISQSMVFGLALNLHDDVPADARWLTQSVILASTALVVALLGGQLFRAAWAELRRGRLTIEGLFLLTMTGAMAASLQAHFTGHGKLYFEVVSILLVVYTLGKVIGARSRAAALAGSRAWAGQLDTCRLVDGQGKARPVPVAEVLPGNVVEVHPGETVAVDGVVRRGTGFVSEAPVSGEPFAVIRRPGDRILAGTASHDATFWVEATAKGTERQVDRLLAAVEQARSQPLSFQGQADQLGRVFFPLVVLTALATFGYWTFLTSAGWEAGLFNAMSVLLVACPCVIGLATPIVIWSALGRLAERGVIVRAGDAVERLAEVDRVLFDKTGTLTEDQFALLDIATAAEGDDRATVLGWLSLVESHSKHPVARPLAQLPRPFGADRGARIADLKAVPGCGVEAVVVEPNGREHSVRIGRPEWVADPAKPIEAEAAASRLLEQLLVTTGHRIDASIDGRLAAVAVIAERLRESVSGTLDDFRRLGLSVEVLTGDTADRAAALNLPPTRAGLLPDDKRRHIDALKAVGGKPLMVGDGINDAAALAAAHVGVAMASGTDLAVGSSTVTLYHGDLRVLPWAVALSREAVRAVRRSLRRAVVYNLIGMALAASGLLHPVVAALLMVASSLSLVFSATRVGAAPAHCGEPVNGERESGDVTDALPQETTRPRGLSVPARQATVHAVSLGLQGVVALLLLDSVRGLPSAALVLGGFAVTGVMLARAWYRWAGIPHLLDMCFGMLTLGNLGMLLGWWVDNGFAPLHGGGCCACVEGVRRGMMAPWMWVGMLAFSNAAMLWFGRRPLPQGGTHVPAMFTGGNLGMVVGMVAGGWCAGQVETGSVVAAASLGFLGMTGGMLAGMLVGTWLVEGLIAAVRMVGRLPAWMRHATGAVVTRTDG